MRKKSTLLSLLFSAFAFSSQAFNTIQVFGFNADVVANGLDSAVHTTTNDVDSVSYNFMAPDYQVNLSAALPQVSLPASGLINSVNTSGLQFQLENYSAYNDLRLGGTSSGTLSFASPSSATVVYLLAVSGSGSSTINAVVTFPDNPTQTFTGVNINDWYNGLGYAIAGIGRVNRTNDGVDNNTSNPRLYEIALPIAAANQSKSISSINITRTGGSGANSIVNVMAVSTTTNVISGTYTINSGQATGGTNFQTFADVAAFLNGGAIGGPVVFNVVAGSGPYNEQVTIPPCYGASSTNTVTINGNGATLTYAGTSTNYATLTLNSTDYFTLNNLNVVASSSSYAFGISLTNDADYVTINGCNVSIPLTVTTTLSSCVVVTGSVTSATTSGSLSNNLVLSNNTFSGSYYAVSVYGGSAAYVDNVQIINNTVTDFYGYGIYINYASNVNVSGNDVSRPTRTASTSTYPIRLSLGITGAVVANNKVHNLFTAMTTNSSLAYVFYLSASGTSGAENVLKNNSVYNIEGNGTLYGIYSVSGSYWGIYNNTVNLDYSGTTTGAARGIFLSSASNINLKNNIVSVTRAGTGVKFCMYFSGGSNLVADRNNYYLNAGGTGNYPAYYNANQASLSAWQTASGQDANAKAINPRFISASYPVPSIDSLDNLGMPVTGITTDILGVVRSTTTPDMGAYEFLGYPLPVKLTNFAVKAVAEDALVTWATATETNTKSFTVQRSADGRTFADAGLVAAKGSNSKYSFTDRNFAAYALNNVVYYRLVTNDYSETTVSATVALNVSKAGGSVSVYPNPFSDKLVVNLATVTDAQAVFVIRDVLGKTVHSTTAQLSAGSNAVSINDLAGLPAGIYGLTVAVNGAVYQYKLSK